MPRSSEQKRLGIVSCFVIALTAFGCAAQAGPEEQIPSPPARAVSESLTPVKSADGKWGFQGKDGKYRIPPQFDQVKDFSEGLAAVEMRGKFGYVDTSGKVVIAPKFIYAEPFCEGLALVYTPSGFNIFGVEGWDFFRRAGYIDHAGKFVIGPRFVETASSFSEGLAAFQAGTTAPGMAKWGYLDKTGNWAIKPRFDVAGNFSEGLAAVAISQNKGGAQKVGYIDRTGDFVIPPQFHTAFPFKNGIAEVSIWDSDIRHAHWKCIGRKGEAVACPPSTGRPMKPAGAQPILSN